MEHSMDDVVGGEGGASMQRREGVTMIRYDCRASTRTDSKSLSLARSGHAGGGSFRFRALALTGLVSRSDVVAARVLYPPHARPTCTEH